MSGEVGDLRKEEIALRQEIAAAETENKDQGKRLAKLDEGVTYMKEIKLLMEDLRMWTARNEKMEADFKQHEHKRRKEQEVMSKLDQDKAKIV